MGLATQIYFSNAEVLVETQNSGIIDVSEDIISCSVTRRMDSVSSANVSLNNRATFRSGKYTGVIRIGDRASVSFSKNGQRVDQLVGRVSSVPVFGFQMSQFDIRISDIIEDFNYMYWDPYSSESWQKYTMNAQLIADDTKDSGTENRLYQFLQEVCGLDKSMIKIAKFPGTAGVVKRIIDMTVSNTDVDKDKEAEKMYNLFFGTSNMLSGSDQPGNNGLSPSSKTSADNQAKIINKMLGTNAKSEESMSTVAFDSTHGRVHRQTWSQHDGASIHTGLYGLSKEQMKQHGGVNDYAKNCSAAKQTKAMTSIMNEMKGTIASNIWYYFTGFGLKYGSGGKIDYSGHGALYIKNLKIVSKTDWESVLNLAIDSAGVDGSKNDGKPKDNKQNGGTTKYDPGVNAKWDAFYNAHHAGLPQVDADGYAGAQCWDLYIIYCKSIFGQAPSLQPPGGNGGYWDGFPGTEPKLSGKMVKVPKNEKGQKGDIAFWQWSGPGGDPHYGHVAIVTADDGNKFTVLEQGRGFGANVHQGTYTRDRGIFKGFLRPKMFGGNLQPSDGIDTASQGSGDGMSVAERAARNETFKLFKFINYDDQQQRLRSNLLGGDVALKNDRPVIDFIRSLCKSTMRSFMSLPDGSFAAFVPDWFGLMTPKDSKNNVISIPDVELKSGFNIQMDKSSYVSHLFLTTSEYSLNAGGMTADLQLPMILSDKASSGTVSIEKQGEALLGLINISATGFKTMSELLQKWGASVKVENDEYIIDHTMTSVSALFRFMRYWSNLYRTSVSLTFRPEIMPGNRLYIESADVTVFVETVTHSWSAVNGGSTTVSVVAPVDGDGRVGV